MERGNQGSSIGLQVPKGRVVYREKAGVDCPNCSQPFLVWAWIFQPGTTKTSIQEWSPEQRNKACEALQEYCTFCGYHNRR